MDKTETELVLGIVKQCLELLQVSPTPPTKDCYCVVCQVKYAVMTLVVIDPLLLVEVATLTVFDEASISKLRMQVIRNAELAFGKTMEDFISNVSVKA